MVASMLWLGIYSGRRRYRAAARFGWFLLFGAIAVIAFGLYHRAGCTCPHSDKIMTVSLA